MGKIKEIFNTLKGIVFDSDDVHSKELSTDEQIDIIRNSNLLEEDEKRELTESVTKFDPNHIFRTSELKIQRSISNSKKEEIKTVELNSIKNVTRVKGMVDNINNDRDR